jgi:para-nitrobenzyl esterase
MRRSLALLAVLVTAGLATSVLTVAGTASAQTAPDTVHTDNGTVRGLVTDEIRTFRGIPYAAPPTGPLRWRSPQPATDWPGVRDATRYADACAQSEHPAGVASLSEDCLYLDVTTPATSRKNRPVLVWIHGGSFKHGATSNYGPNRLAAQGDLVVVQVQYRLGVFGFLAGSYGLEDQQAALRWVRRNAAAFGGDPHNVTIMGESAGAYSVCDHLASPAAAGLFQRAIIQSGPCSAEWSPTTYAAARPRAVAEQYARDLAARLNSDDLREVTTERLLAATENDEFGPVLETPVLPLHPAEALLTSKVNRVPVLHGVNHDEEHGRYGAQEAATGVPISPSGYEAMLKETFPGKDKEVLARYPVTSDQPAGLMQSRVLTDYLWSYPAARTNSLLARRMPTYTFEFAGDAPWYKGLTKPEWPVGSHHVSDVSYLLDIPYLEPLDPAQQRLSDEVIARWSAFARSGDPNVAGGVHWPRAGVLDRQVQSLNPAGTNRTDFHAEHNLALWDALYQDDFVIPGSSPR